MNKQISKVEAKALELYPECVKGGSFDDGHLGGCGINGDPATHYPKMWTDLVKSLGVKSVLDVGCGFGYSLDYFINTLGLQGMGVEGSLKVKNIALNSDIIKHHDYSTGPFIPDDEYDLAWSCEFVEHVDKEFISNFMSTFKKCKYIVLTYASIGQSGHNHVNENTEDYWIKTFFSYGFEYEPKLTFKLRELAFSDFQDPRSPVDQSPIENWTYLYHFVKRGLCFKRI